MKYFLLLSFFLIPNLTFAHTKWFAERELEPLLTDAPTGLYLTIWTLVILAIVAGGSWLERRRWLTLSFLEPKKSHAFPRAASTFAMVVGAFLVIAGTHTYLFSPNLTTEAGIPLLLIYIQILLGLAFLLGLASRTSGLILALLWALQFPFSGWVTALENIWVLSTALFLTLMGNDYFSVTSFSILRPIVAPLKHYALSILRVGTGLTLMVLGLSEKILAPEYGVNFLSNHHWNFMSTFPLPFSDYLFTLSAGSVEFLFGLIFLLGICTRLNALVVAFVFTIPLFILGPIELAGHLPHFAAIVMLLLFGNGGHWLLVRPRN